MKWKIEFGSSSLGKKNRSQEFWGENCTTRNVGSTETRLSAISERMGNETQWFPWHKLQELLSFSWHKSTIWYDLGGDLPSVFFLIGLELPVWGMIKLKCWMLQTKLNNCVATFAIVKRVLAWYSQISPGYILIQEINACISTVRIFVLTANSALYVFVLAWSSHDFHTMSHSTFKFRMG
jgi:hypothetical protein